VALDGQLGLQGFVRPDGVGKAHSGCRHRSWMGFSRRRPTLPALRSPLTTSPLLGKNLCPLCLRRRSVVDETPEHDYWAQSHASVDPDLKRILSNSNRVRSRTGEVEVCMISVPPESIVPLP